MAITTLYCDCVTGLVTSVEPDMTNKSLSTLPSIEGVPLKTLIQWLVAIDSSADAGMPMVFTPTIGVEQEGLEFAPRINIYEQDLSMSFTISYNHDAAGETLYAILRDAQGQMWHVANGDFEAYTGTTSDHALTMTGGDLGNYFYNFTNNLSISDEYAIEIFQQTGGSPSNTFGVDIPVHSSQFGYASDIAAEVTDVVLYSLGGGSGGTGGSGVDSQSITDIIKYVKAILSNLGKDR